MEHVFPMHSQVLSTYTSFPSLPRNMLDCYSKVVRFKLGVSLTSIEAKLTNKVRKKSEKNPDLNLTEILPLQF